MITEARIKEVMREKNCDYNAACSWLSRRGVQAKAAKKRAAKRKARLEELAAEQERKFQQMKASRPDLYN